MVGEEHGAGIAWTWLGMSVGTGGAGTLKGREKLDSGIDAVGRRGQVLYAGVGGDLSIDYSQR
jgi:hypothetical protein